jgi:orotate phosphoribosyltransferase
LIGAGVAEGFDLEGLLREVCAVKEGHFLLASGRHSDRYVEKFDLLRNPGVTERCLGVLAEILRGERIDVVVGPTTGGILLAFELARQLGVPAAYAEPRSDGGLGREFRRGTRFAPDARVLVVDDILTTGKSLRETLAALQAHHVNVALIAVLVDRSGGGSAHLGYPLRALATMDIATWETAECPLCRQGIPLIKPGTSAAGSAVKG